jgi:hypothetical protein
MTTMLHLQADDSLREGSKTLSTHKQLIFDRRFISGLDYSIVDPVEELGEGLGRNLRFQC